MRPIDADALIKRWDEMSVRGRTEFDQEIMVAPSIDIDRPQGEWIPCEERLPEADGLYLATFTLIGIPKFSNVESFKNGKWEYHNGYIIAWQPLPKPWKGADDED